MAGDGNTTWILDDDSSSDDDPAIRFEDWEAYRIESLLGQGGMARVYKAFDPKLNRYVALKFIRSADDQFKKRLLREARAQAQIEHDNVCKIYEVSEFQGKPYIAMQLIRGGTLQQLASEMSLEQKILIFERVSDALHAAHKLGIVHRDIKPSNIMVERKEDGSFRPYVMDFGIAREINDPGITATNAVIGTPAFMAPEQVLGAPQLVDRRTDVFCLGATLYCVLTGKQPFEGTGMDVMFKIVSEDPVPLKKLVQFLPQDLDIIVSKCLEKEPTTRYDSTRALADDLKRFIDGEPILARRASLAYRLAKKIRKNKKIAATMVVALIIIFASAGFGVFSYLRTSQQVKIAREMSRSVEAMDWIMRVAMMAPLHDIRKERGQVIEKMKEVRALMKEAGPAGVGPGNYALGRGFMLLQNHNQARIHLEKAWASGYRDKQVTNALGIVLGEQFREKRSEANRISDPVARKTKLAEFEHDYRTPAIEYLKRGSVVTGQSRNYGEALLAYYEKDWNRALRLISAALNESVWLHEARLLKGDIYFRLGEDAFQLGKYEDAKKHLQIGISEYNAAGEIARSDPALYESQCGLWRTFMEIQFATGEDAKDSYVKSNAACRTALIANQDSATAYNYFAQTSWRWGEHLFEIGDDPTGPFNTAIELSGKAQHLDPNHSTGYYIMGTAYGYLADYEIRIGRDPSRSLEKSIGALLLALEKNPRDELAYVNLGVAYFSQGVHEFSLGKDPRPFLFKAIEAYRKSSEIVPMHNAFINMGNAFANIGMEADRTGEDPMPYFNQSVENYREALKLNPNYWLILTNLSSTYVAKIRYEVEQGKDATDSYKNIVSLCDQSLRLNPQNLYATVNLAEGNYYFASYQVAEGKDPRQWIEKADSLLKPLENTEVPEIFATLVLGKRIEAEYLLKQKKNPAGSLGKSKGHLRTLTRVNPGLNTISLDYARLNLIQAEWEILKHRSPDASLHEAEKYIAEAVKLNPNSAAVYLTRAEIALKAVQWKESQKQPNSAEIKAGLSAINRAIEIKSNDPKAYLIRDKLLQESYKFD